MVKGQVTLTDLVDLYARWQRLLPLSNETRPHVIREQLLSKLPWIKDKVVKRETKNSPDSYVVGFSGLDPSPGRAPFEKEVSKYSAQRCTRVPEIVSHCGPEMIVDCKGPYLQEWILQLNNTPHTRGYTMKVEKRRPRLKPEEIYALAHKSESEREALERLNKGDKTTVTYTHRPSHKKTAVNAVKPPELPPKGGGMWPYPWTHVGTPSHLGHMDRVAATMPSQAHAGAAQKAPDIGQWEGQDVPLVSPSSCIVKGGIPSSRSYLPTYLNAVNADATADPNTSEPADTSVNAVGHPKPPAKKTVDPGPKPPPTFWVLCSKHWKTRKQTEMDMSWIYWCATNSTLWMCKPNSPFNDTHWSVAGKSKGGRPKGRGGDKGGTGGKGGGGKGDKGGEGALYGRGRL